MQNTIYLAPGFFVTLEEKRQTVRFTQFPGQHRKATPWRLELIDTFNRGYHGQREDLIVDLAQR